MINNRPYIAFISFLLMPCLVSAQDTGTVTEDFADPFEQTVPVADEATAEVPAADPDAVTEEKLFNEFDRYRKLINEGSLDEADTAAKRIVEMAIKIYGPQSRETASALNNLGIVQHRNGQFDAAIQNFTSTIEILETTEDRLNSALVNPLKGLGTSQLSIGRPDQAQKTFDRATHISHVNDGPHNVGQIEILDSLAESYVRMNDMKSARKILDRIHIINVSHFEQDPVGLLPSLMSRAEWQHRVGLYAEERVSYRRAIRIIESSEGKESTLLVAPLRQLGETFYFVDLSMATPQQQGMVSTGESYFRRSVRIAEKSPDMDWRESTTSRVALADYYNYIEAQNKARKAYRKTWDFLTSSEERLDVRDELFADPAPIRVNILPTFAGNGPADSTSDEEMLTGKIVASYSVSAKGRIRDLRTGAEPAEFTDMQRMVHREVRSRPYRPRVIEGEQVAAEGLNFEHEFQYFQSDLDQIREALAEPPSSKKE
jgi:tetratricopeptide (TPR) repeat protein